MLLCSSPAPCALADVGTFYLVSAPVMGHIVHSTHQVVATDRPHTGRNILPWGEKFE